tara:strand:+ start:13610 stop:15745 length:2136 start_codon:yes stop_codon:yes gene_type:complete
MAITNALNLPRNSYTATSSQTAFAVGFEFYQVSDIKVYKNGSLMTYNAAPSTNATYSITGTASSSDSAYEFGGGGSITFGSGLTSGDIVVIVRDIAVERTVDFNPSSAFDITTLNTQLDTIIGMIADREKQGDRSVKLLDADTISATVTLPLKATRASKILSFDADGNTETTLSTSSLSTLTSLSTELTALANVSTEIGRLGTTAAVADMAILGTSAIVADMAILGTDAVVADMAILATSAIVTDMSILGTADVVADMNVLATADVVSDMNTLGTADVVSDMNTLASSTVVTNIATVAANVAGVNSFAERYRVTGGDPGSDNDAGDLNYNTSSNALKYWDGSSWNTIASSYSIDTATDTNLTSPADGAMLLYDTGTSKWIDNVMSGDATMADTGAITIGNDKIDSQHYVAASIDNEHLADNAVGTDEIADDAVTYAKMQNVSASDRILGRDSASAGVIEEITPANLRTMINVADGSNAYVHPNHTGEVTSTADGATVIADNVVDESNLKVSNSPVNGYMLTAQSGNTGGLTWAEAGGGATTLISTVTTSSNGGTIEIATSGYNSYILDIGNWRHTGGGTEKLHCTLKRSGESSYDTSYGYGVINLQTAAVLIDTTGASNIVLNGGIRKGDSGSTRLFLNNFGTDALISSVFGQTVQSTNGHASSFTDTVQVFSAGGAIDDADSGDVITHILLGLTGDEFPAGIVYRLYGIT